MSEQRSEEVAREQYSVLRQPDHQRVSGLPTRRPSQLQSASTDGELVPVIERRRGLGEREVDRGDVQVLERLEDSAVNFAKANAVLGAR